MLKQHAANSENVNLLADTDNESDDLKTELNSRQVFCPRDISSAENGETEPNVTYINNQVSGCVADASLIIRLGFLRKVLGIVSFQLLLTIGICTAIYFLPNSKKFISENSWILFPNLFGSIALIIALHIKAKEVPLNYFLLASFTTVQALTLGCVVALFEAKVIFEATIITALIVAGLFSFTLQTKHDFSASYAITGSLLSVFLLTSFFQLFFLSPASNFIFNLFGAGVFCVLLVVDLQMIMYRFPPEEYICACVALYLDILNLFIRILQVVAEANK